MNFESEKNQQYDEIFDLKKIESESETLKNKDDLFKFEKKYFAKEDGLLTKALSSLGKMDPLERKKRGAEFNDLREKIKFFIEEARKKIKFESLSQILESGKIDVSAPANYIHYFGDKNGYIHPLTKTIHELSEILSSQDFSIFEGQDVEDDMHNFSYLNTDENHPARSMHDTIYVDANTVEKKNLYNSIFHSNNLLLRTHTSPGQIRISRKILDSIKKKYINSDLDEDNQQFEEIKKNIAFKFASIGKTYRNDNDATHSPMFHQMEVVALSTRICVRDLMSMLADLLKKFFCDDSLEIRIRPSYFPFTQPSWEVDLFLKKTNSWVEVLGSGMVHPSVVENMGLDPKFIRGYAFGAGIERLCMLKNGITDLRSFYGHNLSWLAHQSQKINL
jgi:phenylalanyl-tRNA synthetase alpha chain